MRAHLDVSDDILQLIFRERLQSRTGHAQVAPEQRPNQVTRRKFQMMQKVHITTAYAVLVLEHCLPLIQGIRHHVLSGLDDQQNVWLGSGNTWR